MNGLDGQNGNKEEKDAVRKPPKKTKWYWTILGVVAMLWMLGGINILLLRDIPLLLFLGIGIGLISLPVARWLGRPKSRWINAVWGIGIIFTMAALVLFIIPPFSISRQTTYLTEPRSDEFYGIDYAAVIEQKLDPKVPPEENGFRPLIETCGHPFLGKDLEDKHWDRLCRYLDLPTDIEPKITFIDWQTFVKSLAPEEKEIAEKVVANADFVLPWSEEAVPIVRRWLDENDEALDLFAEAAQKPVLYVPPMFDDILISTILINDDTCRRIARNLQIRVRYRLATGEIDKAWNDVLAIYRLAEQHRRAVWNVVSSLVNNAIVRTANRSAEAVLLHSDWNTEEIRRKTAEIVPFLQPFTDEEIKGFLLNERFTALDAIQRLANGNYDFDALSNEEPVPAESSFDRFKRRTAMRFCRMGIAMTGMNRRFDELEQQFFSELPMPDDDKTTSDSPDPLKALVWNGQINAVPTMIGEVMGSLFVPPFEAWRTSLKTRQTDIELLHFLFALEAYKRDHNGNYPEKLDDLHGKYLDEIPLDPFSKESFCYTVTSSEDGKRAVLLYSVGPNGIDEEGRNWQDVPKGDDIRRRLPLARDETHTP